MKGQLRKGLAFFVRASHLPFMSQLHMTRVAVGCSDYPALEARIATYAKDGEIRFTTRFKPKRADELIGGRLHFIVKHMLVARVQILRFDDRSDGRVDIVCVADLERVHPQPKRRIRGGAIWPMPTRPRDWRMEAASASCRPNSIANSPGSA